MNITLKQTLGRAFWSLLAAGCVMSASAAVLYDNSQANEVNIPFAAPGSEFGDQVILSLDGSSTWAQVTNFTFQYWLKPGANGDETARLRFYENDGTAVSGQTGANRMPGTLLWASEAFSIGTTAGATLIFDAAAYTNNYFGWILPEEFTWTVEFGGIDPGEGAGLDIYGNVVTGGGHADIWVYTNATWELRSRGLDAQEVPLAFDFAALISGVSPSTPQAFSRTVYGNEGEMVQFVLDGYSPTGLPITYQIVSVPMQGSIVYDAPSRAVTYTPNAKFNGSDILRFTVRDGAATSSVATVTIAIAYRNEMLTPILRNAGNNPATLYNPVAIASADFDGDTNMDLLIAGALNDVDPTEYAISTLMGDASGGVVSYSGVGTPITLPNNDAPVSLAIAKLNADAHNDFVVTTTNGYVLVYTNSASVAEYQAAFALQFAGTRLPAVVANDFNADSRMDLAVLLQDSNKVVVMTQIPTNAGSVFWRGLSTNTVGTTPTALAAGDFNKDNIMDLVVANANSSTISVLYGTGGGNFETAVSYTVGTNPVAVAVGDVNGDAYLDIVTANKGEDSASVLLNSKAKSFYPAVNYGAKMAMGYEPNSVVLADFNGDGKVDIALSQVGDNAVEILTGTGTGTFNYYWADTDVHTVVGEYPIAMVMGDFNRDGALDIITANTLSGDLTILLNNIKLVANAISVSVNEDAPAGGSVVLSGYYGVMDYVITKAPTNGTLTLSGAPLNLTSLPYTVATASATPVALRYLPVTNGNGIDRFIYQVTDGTRTSRPATNLINVVAVNDPPRPYYGGVTLITVNEDSPAYLAANFASCLDKGAPNEVQTISYFAVAENPALFKLQPAVSVSGALTFTPAKNAYGTSRVTINAVDNGPGSGFDVNTSSDYNLDVTINSVNDEPVWTGGVPSTISVFEGGSTTNTFYVTDETPLADLVTNLTTNPALPAGITASLTRVNTNTLRVVVTAADGIPPLATTTLTVTVGDGEFSKSMTGTLMLKNVNHPPTYNLNLAYAPIVNGTNQVDITVKAGVQTLLKSPLPLIDLASVVVGPPSESAQTMTYQVLSGASAPLFSGAPAVYSTPLVPATDGQLRFVLLPLTIADNGKVIPLVLKGYDNGTTANGGNPFAVLKYFNVKVTVVP